MADEQLEPIEPVSESVQSHDQDLHQISDRLEKIHEDHQGIIKYIDWLGRRMDAGFKFICAPRCQHRRGTPLPGTAQKAGAR